MQTKEEALSILKTHPNGNIEEPQFKKKFPEHYQILSTWKFPSNFKFTQKLFHYFNDDPELKLGLCLVCGNRCKFTKFNRGYALHCCKKCADVDTNTKLQREKTCQKKYGVKNTYQSEEKKQKIKETLLERYGVEHPLQSDTLKKRLKETSIKRYGVENYSQTQEWSHKKQKRITYKKYSFDSSWELDVFKYCEENNISCIYQPNITFDYEFNGIVHKYHPDFLIDNKLYEVKGNQFFDGDKMICPYDRNDYKDSLAEAKHQCIIKNGIIILKGEDIIKLKEIL